MYLTIIQVADAKSTTGELDMHHSLANAYPDRHSDLTTGLNCGTLYDVMGHAKAQPAAH